MGSPTRIGLLTNINPTEWSQFKQTTKVIWLVVDLPLWKYESQLGSLFPTEWKNKDHVPNHQPVESSGQLGMIPPYKL